MKLNQIDEKQEPEYPAFKEQSRRAFLKKLAVASAVVVTGGGAWYSFASPPQVRPSVLPSPPQQIPVDIEKVKPLQHALKHQVRPLGEMVQPAPPATAEVIKNVRAEGGMPAPSQPVHIKGDVKAPGEIPRQTIRLGGIQKAPVKPKLEPRIMGKMIAPQPIMRPSPREHIEEEIF